MPWCEPCARFYNPNTLSETGDCPAGHHVVDPDDEEKPKIPWHFWMLLIALVLYLGWRAIQGIVWLLS
jgi:hypothetical protein